MLYYLISPTKRLPDGLAFLVDAFGLNKFLEGDTYHFHICHQGYIIDIPDIQFELLRQAKIIANMTLRPYHDNKGHPISATLRDVERSAFKQKEPSPLFDYWIFALMESTM